MKKFCLLVFLPLQIIAQNTIGFPDIINYSKQVYNAGLQNWDIKQDGNGIIYLANNEGLLTFNGRKWKIHPLPNKTIVRSLAIGKDNRIYVGGQDELGYFAAADNGILTYFSLTNKLSAGDKSFGDVWDIVTVNTDIFFRSTHKIFKFSNQGAVAVYKASSEWSYISQVNGQLYAHDYKTGLLKFENSVWNPLSTNNILPLNEPVTSILSIRNDSALVTTLKNGMYLISKSGVSKLPFNNESLFKNERVYAATKVNNNWFAFATNNNGIYITDIAGNIIQHFSRTEGLQNNNVLSIYYDNQGNLWLGLDNGIDFIAYNSSIKQIKPLLQEGSGYTSLIKDNRLYLGTSNGLFSVPIQNERDLSFNLGNFTEVNNTKGQTWSLTNINNQLLLGHHEGAFTIQGNTAIPISEKRGVWNFKPISNTFPTAQMIAGDYNGLAVFDYANGQFNFSHQIPDFVESSRYTAIDADKNIWVSHPYHGVFKITVNGAGGYSSSLYAEPKGLPAILNNHIFTIKNELVAGTEKGIYVYNKKKDLFELSPFYLKVLGNQSIRYLKEDTDGNIWFIHEKTLGVIDFSNKEPELIYMPELNNKMLSGFEFIYAVNKNNIFLGGEKGFIHINYEKYKQTKINLGVQIRSLVIIGQIDSVLFGGYYQTGKQEQHAKKIPVISYQWKTLRFEYSSTLFGGQSNLEFSYRLKGYDDKWSEWTNRTEKEYTNIPPGKFSFEVKVRNNLGNESAASVYTFKILPPWYKSNWAKVLYLILFLFSLFIIYKWQEKKFKLQQIKFNEEQAKQSYIHELELSKTETELVAVKNEKLESDINFKNSELASSAMHLVQKGELVAKIKGELNHVMKEINNPQAVKELKKLIKTIGEDDNTDNEWEKFTQHFDKVHSDFIVELKEKHPDVSNNEVKLCAYLRMNLSTKEIAQLMNISVRGVEVSRYRLRKKLGLVTETNLFDYLINMQNEAS